MFSRRFRTSICAGVFAAATLLAYPNDARAARVGVFRGELVYIAEPGETLDVDVDLVDLSFVGPTYRFTDIAPKSIVAVAPGCIIALNVVRCGAAGVTSLLIIGGANNDFVRLQPAVTIPAFLAGGGGSDRLEGGSGPDTLTGGPGDDVLLGNAGNDLIFGGTGGNAIDGGAGSDTINFSGLGPDPTSPALTSEPVTGFTASVAGSVVTLRWNAALGALSYRLVAGTAAGLSNAFNANIGDATALVAVAPNGTFFVRLFSVGFAGESGPSTEIVLSVGPGACTSAPAAPSLQVPSVNGSTVVLIWTAAADASNYILEAGSQTGLANLANQAIGNTTTFTAVSVPRGTYFVRVRARNACGTSAPSNERIIVVP